MRHLTLLLAGALVLPGLARAAETPTPAPTPPLGVEARADEVLRAMSAFLAKTPRFALEAEESYDEIADGEPKVELTNVRRIAVERPARAASDSTGDTKNRASWFDGTSVTVLDKDTNVYATVPARKTIDETLDMLQDEYGVVLPLADILYSDPYKVLTAGIVYGRYLGIHQAAGVPCHHLAFAQDTIEWQLWVDASDQPLPRKLVITYVTEPGEPRYSATIRRWRTDPVWPEGLFTFVAPEGATRVDAEAMKLKPAEDEDVPAPTGDAGKGGL